VGLFFGSVRNIAYKFKKDIGISISPQTIENWIRAYKNQNKECSNRYSGYYIFDVEWVKIKGVWNYRFTLFDSKQNRILRTCLEFLEQNTRNKNKIAITSDLDEKYKPIIERLGFKYQWCLFHALKNFKKIIKKYIQENEIDKEEIEEIRKFKPKKNFLTTNPQVFDSADFS